jgi:hypothetical protein
MRNRKFQNLTLREKIGKIRPSDIIAWFIDAFKISGSAYTEYREELPANWRRRK